MPRRNIRPSLKRRTQTKLNKLKNKLIEKVSFSLNEKIRYVCLLVYRHWIMKPIEVVKMRYGLLWKLTEYKLTFKLIIPIPPHPTIKFYQNNSKNKIEQTKIEFLEKDLQNHWLVPLKSLKKLLNLKINTYIFIWLIICITSFFFTYSHFNIYACLY